MSRRIDRMLRSIGLLLFFGCVGTGCTTTLWVAQRFTGLEGSVHFESNASRQDVEEKLGQPATSRQLPDGGSVATYEYSIRHISHTRIQPPDDATNWVAWAGINVITLGMFDIMFFPDAVRALWKNRRAATFTFDTNGRVLDHGPPPPFGPADDAVGSLSLNEIRERCRSEVSGDLRDLPGGVTGRRLTTPRDLYDECLVRRLAIWGIE